MSEEIERAREMLRVAACVRSFVSPETAAACRKARHERFIAQCDFEEIQSRILQKRPISEADINSHEQAFKALATAINRAEWADFMVLGRLSCFVGRDLPATFIVTHVSLTVDDDRLVAIFIGEKAADGHPPFCRVPLEG